jgi:hypothetical protein
VNGFVVRDVNRKVCPELKQRKIAVTAVKGAKSVRRFGRLGSCVSSDAIWILTNDSPEHLEFIGAAQLAPLDRS